MLCNLLNTNSPSSGRRHAFYIDNQLYKNSLFFPRLRKAFKIISGNETEFFDGRGSREDSL